MCNWISYLSILAILAGLPVHADDERPPSPGAEGRDEPVVNESARDIPVAYEVDVVVVGGGAGAVAAAIEAADAGASVFLAAPYPYLGEDMTATLRLWLEAGETSEHPLAQALFGEDETTENLLAQAIFDESETMRRPMHIKKTLDEALLDAGVEFLYDCFVTDVVRDGEGEPAGIVMANRAGRQAVLAKVIIDATSRAQAARLAGAEFRDYPSGSHTFQRTVIGGDAQSGEGVRARVITPAFEAGNDVYDVIEYTLELELEDASYASWMKADQEARTLTHHLGQQFTSDLLFQIPPDPVRARAQSEGAWEGPDAVPLDALRPEGVRGVYVLGGCADVTREQARELLRPLALIKLGARAGAAAAGEALSMDPPSGVHLPGEATPSPVAAGDTKELLEGVRTVNQSTSPHVAQASRSVPVFGEYDVVVVGGGTGGAPAGIAAARAGAAVLVIELRHMLGGVGTTGQITGYYHGRRVGFTNTVLDGATGWHPERKHEWWRREILDAGGALWFGALGCGAFVDDDRVRGVVVATPHGRGVVLADVVIDSTGNSDVAAPAGAETDYIISDDFAQQGAGTTFRRFSGGGPNTSFTMVDKTDPLDLWHVRLWTKQMFANAFDQAELVNTRERRRIVGDFTMTALDQIIGRTYPDTISQAESDFDTHGYTIDPFLLFETPPHAQTYVVNVPFRSLLPRGLEGMLATGLGISMHRDAVPLMRMQACIQNQGYAAGLAAAKAAREGVPLREIDIRALQRELVEIGNLPEEVLEHEDSLPMSEEEIARAIEQIPAFVEKLHVGGYRRLEEIARRFEHAPSKEEFRAAAIVFQHPEEAKALLREAYESSGGETGEARYAYAKTLAMLGDPAGAHLLLERVRAADEWDTGWRYASMSNFGSSLSPLDTAIVALARAGYEDAVPVILEKTALLDAESEFSHHRAAALALELLGEPSAAPALAELLSKPGMSGHVHDTIDAARRHHEAEAGQELPAVHAIHTRRDSMRELLLARALYRCGDHEGLGREILENYARDLRGHLVRHAKAVLEDDE